MSKVIAFRPKTARTVDFLLLALASAMKKNGPIVISKKDLEDQWSRTLVTWDYMGDGTVKFRLEKLQEEK